MSYYGQDPSQNISNATQATVMIFLGNSNYVYCVSFTEHRLVTFCLVQVCQVISRCKIFEQFQHREYQVLRNSLSLENTRVKQFFVLRRSYILNLSSLLVLQRLCLACFVIARFRANSKMVNLIIKSILGLKQIYK